MGKKGVGTQGRGITYGLYTKKREDAGEEDNAERVSGLCLWRRAESWWRWA